MRSEELKRLIVLYNDQKMRPSEIGPLVGRSSSSVRQFLQKEDIPIKWSAKKVYSPYRPVSSEETLRKELISTIKALEKIKSLTITKPCRVMSCNASIARYKKILDNDK